MQCIFIDSSELKECKKQLKDARFTISRLEADVARISAQFQAESNAMSSMEKQLRARVEKLEKDRKYLFQKEKEAQQKLKAAHSETLKVKVIFSGYSCSMFTN